jgi:uncharacterized protein (DUF433 family)
VSDDQLIQQYIDLDSDGYAAGVADARLREYGVPVWALIGHLRAVDGDVDRVAQDYVIPLDAVRAALAYYERYKPYIDARLLLNSA